MRKKFLNDSARQYARHMNPNIRKQTLLFLLGSGAVVYGCGMAAMAVQANAQAENFGRPFANTWRSVRAEYGHDWRNGTIGIMVTILLIAYACFDTSKFEARRYADFVAKRYLHDLHIDVKDADNRVFGDIADLLLANMSNAERENMIDIGVSVANALNGNVHLSDIKRKQILIDAKNRVSKTLDSVMARNPQMESLIWNILAGQTYYNPHAFNKTLSK